MSKRISEIQFQKDLDELSGKYEFINGKSEWVINKTFRSTLERYIARYADQIAIITVKHELNRAINHIATGKDAVTVLTDRLEQYK